MLAALALLTVTIRLIKIKRLCLYTGIPMAFMLITAVVAAIYSIWMGISTRGELQISDFWLDNIIAGIICGLDGI